MAHTPGCVAGVAPRTVLFFLLVLEAHENDAHPNAPIAMDDLGLRVVAAGLALGIIQDGLPVGGANQDATWLNMIRDQEVSMLAAPRAGVAVDELPHHQPCLPRPQDSHSNPHNKKSYASTYQVTHCGAHANPPTTCVTEFPPQRSNFSPRTQLEGNFEVGVGNSISRSPAPVESFRKIRHDDGRVCAIRPDRDVDAFVSSLRRYPAQRSPSSDLMDKLLKAQSFPKESAEANRTGDKHVNKEQRNVAQQRKKEDRRPLRKTGTVLNAKTKVPSINTTPEVAVETYEEGVSSFDYLNSAAWVDKGKRENRVLPNIFRDLYHAERGPVMAFPVCPAMQGRYERHVKKCHQPTTSQIAQVDASDLKTCTKCLKRRPCPCEAIKSVRLLADKDQEEKRALEDTIFSWLNEIPIYPNEKPQDKFIRDAIVKKLAETINCIKEEDIANQGKEAIRKAIDKLPMWYPKDERDRENFINNITDSLLYKIKGIKDKKKVSKAAGELIDTIDFDNTKDVNREDILNNITKELDKLALNRPEDDNLYRDMIKIKAFELLDHLPIKVNRNRYEYLNKLSDDFADRIMEENSNQGTLDQDTNDMIKEEITEILDSSNATIRDRGKVEGILQKAVADIVRKDMGDHTASEHIKSVLKGKVSDDDIKDIAEKVVTLVDRLHSRSVDRETKEIIKENVNDILNDSGVYINRDKVEDNLHKAVAKIFTQDMDKDKAIDHIKLAFKGMVPKDKVENIAEQVFAMTDGMKSAENEMIDSATIQKIKENISDIFNASEFYNVNRGKLEEILQKTVADIVRRGIERSKAVTRIKTVLKGKVPNDKIENMIEQVLNLADQVRPDKSKTIDRETKQMIKEDIGNILDLSNVHVKDRGKIENSLQKVVADIVEKDMDENKAVANIKSVLKRIVTVDKLEDIIEQVLNLADNIRPHDIKTIDQDTKKIITEDIDNILDLSDVPVKDRSKIEESLQKAVADIVGTDMNESKAVSYIKSVLKGKVPGDEMEDIIEQVLNVADHVRPRHDLKKLDRERKQIIKGDINNILDSFDVHVKNRGTIENSLQKIVAGIVEKDMDESKAVDHIKSVLKGKVPGDEMEDIIEQVLNVADHVRPKHDLKKLDRERKQIIKGDISNILDSSDVHVKNRGTIENSLQKVVAGIVEKDMDESKAVAHIKSVLKGKVSGDKMEEMIEQVLNLADQVKPHELKTIDREMLLFIEEDIRNILDLSDYHVKDRGKIENSLQNVVADIVEKDMDESKAVAHIKSVLKGKVPGHKIENIIDQVLNLANHVRPHDLKTIDSKTKQNMKENIGNILDLSDVPLKNRGTIEDSLQKAVAYIVEKDMDESKAVAHIKLVLKGKVPGDKMEDIIDQVLNLADHVRLHDIKTIDQETMQIIKEDIGNILDLSHVPVKSRGKIEESLQKVVADIVRTDMDESKAVAHIKSVLKGKVPGDEMEDVIEQVLNVVDHLRPRDLKTLDRETKKIIKKDISNILDSSDLHVKNRGKIEDCLQKIVTGIVEKDIDESNAVAHIKFVFKGKVPGDKMDGIIEQVLNLADYVRPHDLKTIDRETKQNINEDIRNILDLSDVPLKNRGKIEENLQKAVAAIVERGMDESKAVAHIKSALKGKVRDDKIEDIAEQVLTLVDHVRPHESKMVNRETEQLIKEDINDILDLSGVRIKNRGQVEESIKKAISDVINSDIDQSKAVARIKGVLKGKVPDNKIQDIAEQVFTLADQSRSNTLETIMDTEIKQTINDDIRNILDLSHNRIKNRGKVEDYLNKVVTDIIRKNMGKDQAIIHIKNVLEGKVSDAEIEDIAKQVLAIAIDVKPTESTKIDPEITRLMKGDISDILDLSSIPIKNKGNVEKSLQETVANIVANTLSKDKAISQIKSVLKGKVPDKTADDIAQQIFKSVEKAKPMMMAMAEGDQSMFDSSLQQNISDILDRTSSRITNRSTVEQSLRDILNDLVMRSINQHEAENQIHSIIKGQVSDSQADNISKQLIELAHQLSISLDEHGPSASSTQNAEAMFMKQVTEIVRDWLHVQNMAKLSDKDFRKVVEAISNDVVDRQKYLQLNPGVKTSEEKECEILREQVYKALYKLIDNQAVLSVMSDVEKLVRSLNTIPRLSGMGTLVQDSEEFVKENLEGALLDWLRNSPIYQHRDPRNRLAQERIMSNLAESLTQVLLKENPSAKTDEILLREITKQLDELPLAAQFKSKEYIRMLSIHMLNYLKSLQLFLDISLRTGINDTQRNTSFLPSTNHLSDIVRDWCKDLPLPDTNGGRDIKQDLANKIMLKIGEMNMNQDVFNDDLLYEEMLQEFIEQQIQALNITLDVPKASKQLIDEIMNLKQKLHDSLIVRVYRQQLRDTMSDVLPSIVNPTEEDRAAFELMKENLADAFINLHYSGEDEAIKAKLKRKIREEINKFANDYLGCCPAPPISARELNENLYKALLKVPVPSDDASMRSEVEAVRLKDVVYNWLKILPLGKQSKVEQLHTNKIVTIMCQKLQELENEFNPDFEDIAKEEIKNNLAKLPLKNKSNLDRMAKILVDRIINTSESRSSVERPSTALAGTCLNKTRCLPHQQHKTGISSQASYLSCKTPTCKKDKTKLASIPSQRCEMGTQSTKCCCNDAAVDPSPTDNMSQTEMHPVSKCCQCEKSEPVSKPRAVRIINTPPTDSIGSQADLCPYVRKGYHADCIYGNMKDFSNQTLAPGTIRRCSPPLIPSQGICPHDHDCPTPNWYGMAHRRCRQNLPRVPRRQILSACPNEYIRRPKPHDGGRRNVPPQHLRCRLVEPSCSHKQPCLTSHELPSCPKCGPNIPCPHPTRLYFR